MPLPPPLDPHPSAESSATVPPATPDGDRAPEAAASPAARERGGSSIVVAILLLAASAAVIFAAGLVLGGGGLGRDAEEQAAVEAFVEAWRSIDDTYVGESDPDERLEGAIRGMFETLKDPYSAYLDPAEFSSTFDEIRGQLEGIGALMAIEDDAGGACALVEASCQLRVIEVLPGTPALAAGLRAGDVVSAVDGHELGGSRLDDAVMLIRGPRDTDVRLTVRRPNEDLELLVTRSVIHSQDVRSATLERGSIGYLGVDSFSSDVADRFEEALRGHLDAGIRKLVIDLRDDPGGFVDAAVDIASQFIADGPVFWEEGADGDRRAVQARGGGIATDPDIELVVLVNGGTASASEILAGALQDAGRATLLGETTFGKGSVQEWSRLPDDQGGFRLSVARWLTPDGSSIDQVGLRPDVEVDDGGASRYRPPSGDPGSDTAAVAAQAADPQLQRAVALLLDDSPAATPAPGEPSPSSTEGRP